MKTTLARLFTAAGLSVALACAQGPGPGSIEGGGPPDGASRVQMRVEMLTNALNLTEAQQTKAAALFTEAQTAGETIQKNLQTTRKSITAAVKKNAPATIDELAAKAGILSGQLMAINAKAEAALYATLTSDQKTQYDAMSQRGPGGGPGGPGGGGPGGGERPGPPPQN
jgi:Spy/CpxP family protein refolding chaperone